ncbi:MAG: VWA domain-containing protein [Nannocystaceae bacterium]|nr:VWA domain-containing protein [Nannocystaceae bacterium]
MSRWQSWFFPALVVLAGCDVSPRTQDVGVAELPPGAAPDDGSSEDPYAPDNDGEEGSTSGGTQSTGEDSFESSDATFDVPALPDPVPPGVCDTVDLLFVIDNSGSMADEQANLIASVPGFIEGISDRLGVHTDYHVGVVSTDEATFNADGCQEIGALVTRTQGDLSSDSDCGPYVEGASFMTPQDDLESSFSCAAQLGIDGNGIERPMDALDRALHPEQGVTVCNDGFLRDEALLVVVLITDEEDDFESDGDPVAWYESVVEVKGGDEERVVVLSLVGHPKPNDCIPTQWTGMQGAEIATRILQFTSIFPYGYVGDICSADYEPFFAEATEHIDTACSLPEG